MYRISTIYNQICYNNIKSDGTILDGPLQLPTTPIYNKENRIIAVKAEKQFYYIDDIMG